MKEATMKETSQGLVKAAGEIYVGKDGKERVKFVTVGEAFSGGGDGARSYVRLKLLPFPQPSPRGNCCWLHIFPDGEPLEHEPYEKFKLSGIVLSDGLQIGAEFTSPSGRRTIKLEANPIGKVLKIYDIKPQENKHESKRNRKGS
jgi:hypothetical protein